MSISKEEVSHIAVLARLTLTEEEAERFLHQLNDVLDYMEILNGLDTVNVEPLRHRHSEKNVLREDCPGDSLEPGKALQNTPSRKGDYVTVPKMILPAEEPGEN